MKTTLQILAVVLFAFVVSCGGEDSSTTPAAVVGGGPGASTTLAATFVAQQAAPAAGEVTMAAGPANGALFTVVAQVTGVDAILGASFDVTYDPGLVQFVNWSPGSVLESGGESPTYLLSATDPGRLVVGISRGGSSGAANVDATAPLIRLTFQAIAAGGSVLRFEAADLLGPGSNPEPIPGISWFGGSVAAN